MTTVYIASPYSHGNKEENVQRQIDVFVDLLFHGFSPLAPLLAHYVAKKYPEIREEVYLKSDLAWVKKADCLLRLPGFSHGADLEVLHALQSGVPIYMSVERILEVYGDHSTGNIGA